MEPKDHWFFGLIKKENSSFKYTTIFNPDWWSIRLLDFLPPLWQQSPTIYLWLLPVKPSTFQLSSEDLFSKSALTLGTGIHVSLLQSFHTLPSEEHKTVFLSKKLCNEKPAHSPKRVYGFLPIQRVGILSLVFSLIIASLPTFLLGSITLLVAWWIHYESLLRHVTYLFYSCLDKKLIMFIL